MLKRIIDYGERATGIKMPTKPDLERISGVEDDIALYMIMDQAKNASQEWRRDVRRHAASDLARLLTGTYLGHPEISEAEKEQI